MNKQAAFIEQAKLIQALDLEFIHQRGRSGSVHDRYSQLFSSGAETDHVVLHDRVGIAANCSLRPFTYRFEAHSIQGCMFGLVWVRPDIRGRGWGRKVLQHAEEKARGAGAAFGVLWSSIVGFYERDGWFRSDHTAYAVVEKQPFVASAAKADRRELKAEWERIENIRRHTNRGYVERDALAYAFTPLGAETVSLFVHDSDKQLETYALVGESREAISIYEVGGNAPRVEHILNAVVCSSRLLHINAIKTDSVVEQYRAHGIILTPQAKALIKRFCKGPAREEMQLWSFPYFDWI
jgi:GNAT superfamily N-acetyltransferase